MILETFRVLRRLQCEKLMCHEPPAGGSNHFRRRVMAPESFASDFFPFPNTASDPGFQQTLLVARVKNAVVYVSTL
jgi:hypothetical protein